MKNRKGETIMKITPIQVTIADLTKNYKDDGDGGVFGYNDRLKGKL